MSTLGTQALTLSDLRKRMGPDGTTDFIIEALLNSNPIMDDIPWLEGNLVTGNKTTIRTSMPTPSVRMINRGVKRSKSTTRQVMDTCTILEDRSSVDIELLKLANDPEQFRRSEDAAFVGGFADTVANMLFYGDTDQDAGTFNGLSVRYNVIGGEKNEAGYQVKASGFAASSSNKNTSIYIVGWGTHATTGIYPKNSRAGLEQRDLGERTVTDAEGLEYQAVQTLFTWKNGLAVQDIRANAMVRNIDSTALTTANTKTMINAFITAKNDIRNLQSRDKKLAAYVSSSVYNALEIYLNDKSNVHLTRQELMGELPKLFLAGIEIKRCDAVTDAEPAFPTV